MNTYRLLISTPDGNVLDDPVASLVLRGAEGDLAILAGHIPFVTAIKPGKIRVVYEDASERSFECTGGILSVGTRDVNVLATDCKEIK